MQEVKRKKVPMSAARMVIYLVGMIVLALGIVLNTKTQLGVSPIISVPYSIATIWGWNLGNTTFVFYIVCTLMQIILLRKKFQPYQLLQVVVSLITSQFINLFDWLLDIQPQNFVEKILVLAAAILVTAVGAATMVMMEMVPNPADALAKVFGDLTGKGLGLGKNIFDATCFVLSLLIGFLFAGKIVGIGLGTVCAVVFVGRCIALYNYFFKKALRKMAGFPQEVLP